MMALTLIVWWYTAGWAKAVRRVGERVRSTAEFFSIGQLLSTLFDPFRQISAERVQGSLQAEMKAMGDRLFSRLVGAAVRGMMIVFGLFAILFSGLFGLVQILVWPCLPLLPIVGLIAAVAGWGIS